MAINLTNLFKKGYYIIPDYQRGYSWTDKQIDDFWNDIIQAHKTKQKHYFGTFYLKDAGIRYKKHYYEVIDGQQRLTTLFVLLILLHEDTDDYNAFWSNCIEKNNIWHLNYSEENPNRDYLIEKIFTDDGSERVINIYRKNLHNLKEKLSNKIEGEEDKTSLFNFIKSKLVFDLRYIDGFNENVIFETLNNRGKPLSILEKLKNRLMYLSMKLVKGNELITEINNKWTTIYNILGKIDTKDINSLEDELVSSHLTIYRNSENPTFSARGAEEKLFQMFCTDPTIYPLNEKSDWDKLSDEQKENWNDKEPDLDYDKINNYIESLENFASQWQIVINRKNYAINKCLMQDSSKELKILLTTILMRYNDLNDGLRYELIKLIEKVLFRQNLPGEWQRTHSFSTLAYYFYNRDKMLDEKTINFKGLKNQLLWGLLGEFSAESISQNFKSLYTFRIDNAGFYRWKGLKYFLYEYEESLRDDESWEKDYTELEIEHIIPRKFSQNGWDDVVGKVGKISQNVIVNALGNLMLIDASKNSSIGNSCWQEKKKKYKENSTKCEKDVAKNKNVSWNKDCIYKRNDDMYDFFCKKIRWIFEDGEETLRNCVEFFYNQEDESNELFDEIENSFNAINSFNNDEDIKTSILYYDGRRRPANY